MNRLKKILLIVFAFIPVMLFCSGCNCSGGGGDGEVDDSTYTVCFITNSPIDFNIGPYEVKAGDTIFEPKRPSMFEKVHEDGYTYVYSFVGWYKDPETWKELWKFSDEVHSNLTLYAKWSTTKK